MVHSKNSFWQPLLVVLLVLWLTGCVTTRTKPTAREPEAPVNEALLKAADNHAGLIQLYKTRLQQAKTEEDNKKYRLLLGTAYLNTNDPDSTLFILEPLLGDQQKDAEVWLLKSQAKLTMGMAEESLKDANTALLYSANDPTILNQQGVAYAAMGKYSDARKSINKARETMFDDLVIKNNLAMLDILEQKYDAAIQRLMPLYTSGQADEKIKSNLIIALVRAGLYNEFKTVYTGGKSEQERMSLFIAISSAKFQPQLSGSH
ncbi:hypothetical protein [Parendozoicomonas sp. Alg238-R29]|uniref:tetratricopeptide repeat protein n=1 Tax=Parendozoicomonas sp. Alg238-R29 TaxID=2993446 RepID=UPI00248DB0F8|nr:hypothetical protein [Parendozoicomonas sp. Alg238-R29]